MIVSTSRFYLPQLLSVIFSKQLKAEVEIEEASLSLKDGILTKGISISNKRGLSCSIERATIGTDPLLPSLRRIKAIPLKFELKDITLSYPDSAVINSITSGLSIKEPELLKFDTASGRLYRKDGALILKALSASGEYIRLFVDGTITDDSQISASFRLLLSGELIAGIPESVRKVFFKQDGAWSKVELYLSGDIKRPSINFSTDLFKLIVR